MRVIGGNARGQRLKAPKGRTLRPTAAKVKEALFDILPHDLSGNRVLDLFAGSGNVSIEALSRGAAEAILVDASTVSGKLIRENLRRLHLGEQTEVWIMPVLRALRALGRRGKTFDLIFLDPPYENRWIGVTVAMVAQLRLLRGSGVLIAEHSIREKVEPRYHSLALDDQRRYGSTLLSFFRPEAS